MTGKANTAALVLVGLFAAPAFVPATTLVVLERDGAVYLGADSLRNQGIFGDHPSTKFVCKIRRYGDVLVASAGRGDDEDPRIGLDFIGAYSRASQGWSGSLDRKADLLAQAAAQELRDLLQDKLNALTKVRQIAADLDNRVRRGGADATQAAGLRKQAANTERLAEEVIADLERGSQQLIVVNIGDQRPRVAIRLIKLSHQGQNAAATPSSEAFDGFKIKALDTAYKKMSLSARRMLLSQPPQLAIRRLIENQAQDTPRSVAPPVNIVKIVASGLEWLDAGPECRALHLLR